MSEAVPFAPVVEVRATFTPSERLRDALVNFLDPELDNHTKESLRAAFLFKSWRRRVIERREYYLYEHDRSGAVRDATLDFAALPKVPIPITGEVGVAHSKASGRIVLRTKPNNLVARTNAILDSIPSAEIRSATAEANDLFYLDIAKASLAPRGDVDAAAYMIRRATSGDESAGQFYLKAGSIVVRGAFADIVSQKRDDTAGQTAS